MHRPSLICAGMVVLLWLLGLGCGSGAEPPATLKTAAALKALTGAHTRVVWLQDGEGMPSQDFGGGDQLWLMGLDSDDGKGSHPILPKQAPYSWVYFTPDGQGVAFTMNEPGQKVNHVMYVNWDGTGLKELLTGPWLTAVVADPGGEFNWLYCLVDDKGGKQFKRFRMDKPTVSEPLWDHYLGRMTTSPDGKLIGGVYEGEGALPVGVYDVANTTFSSITTGCQACFLPSTEPYRFFIFNGNHRSGHIFTNPEDPQKRTSQNLDLGQAPAAGGNEVCHPKWSNNVRFMTLDAPWIPGQGQRREVSVGRLDEGLTKVEAWVQITENNVGDYLPEVWIDSGKPKPAPKPAKPKVEPPKPPPPVVWPIDRTGLVYLWENVLAPNTIRDRTGSLLCILAARGRAIPGRNGVMDLVGGSFVAKPDADKALLETCRRGNAFAVEALVQPAAVDQERPQAIVSFTAKTQGDFTLGMIKNRLVLWLNTVDYAKDEPITLGNLKAGTPQHVIMSFKGGQIESYIDGKLKAVNQSPVIDLRDWGPGRLVFGDTIGQGQNWLGTLEGIAIYSRALTVQEAKTHCDSYIERLAKRKPVVRAVVSATLKEVTPNSTLKNIDPYHRLLLVDSFEVVKVLEGVCADKQIAVAHWGILNDEILANPREKGKTYRLVLEPWEDNPQFDSERIDNTNEDLTLPLYFDTEMPK